MRCILVKNIIFAVFFRLFFDFRFSIFDFGGLGVGEWRIFLWIQFQFGIISFGFGVLASSGCRFTSDPVCGFGFGGGVFLASNCGGNFVGGWRRARYSAID